MVDSADVLIVEDSASLRRIYTEYLKSEQLQIATAGTVAEAREAVAIGRFRVVLLDLKLPDGNGFDILRAVVDSGRNIPVIIMTAHGSIGMAVDAMRLGAYDFVEKPFDARRLRSLVNSALVQQRARQLALGVDPRAAGPQYREIFHGFIGASDAMQAVYDLITRAAPSKASVFITGESGTGKELCAEALHQQSARSNGPFIAINCAAIPKDLMESEIFGHVKGAFTGAVAHRDGAASLANGGTLFLDEIGEMSLDLQTKLLRFIQSGIVQKVGSNSEELVDVRFICATNREPLAEVQAGRFREDLYYRLHVIPLALPPLRQRDGDIILIAEHLLRRYAREEGKVFSGFSEPVQAVMRSYDWPGNVRQLQNVIRNIVVLNTGGLIDLQQLPPPLDQLARDQFKRSETLATGHTDSSLVVRDPTVASKATGDSAAGALLARSIDQIRPLAVVEREIIENAIALCGGNIPRAAALLELSPSTIYRKKQGWSRC